MLIARLDRLAHRRSQRSHPPSAAADAEHEKLIALKAREAEMADDESRRSSGQGLKPRRGKKGHPAVQRIWRAGATCAASVHGRYGAPPGAPEPTAKRIVNRSWQWWKSTWRVIRVCCTRLFTAKALGVVFEHE